MTYDCFRDCVREVPAHSKISADVGVIDAQNLVLNLNGKERFLMNKIKGVAEKIGK